ncbi:hypothetical protein SK128_026266 [Halocaridina rubra]|uniref:Uncharacterized protein n=1 Tax=Halocaridina rubra TaxID=373956 RepID=A0AAN8X6X6_HALRR
MCYEGHLCSLYNLAIAADSQNKSQYMTEESSCWTDLKTQEEGESWQHKIIGLEPEHANGSTEEISQYKNGIAMNLMEILTTVYA